MSQAGSGSRLDDETSGALFDIGAEGCTGAAEAVRNPGAFVAVGESRVAVVECEWDDLDPSRHESVESHQPEQAELVAKVRVSARSRR